MTYQPTSEAEAIPTAMAEEYPDPITAEDAADATEGSELVAQRHLDELIAADFVGVIRAVIAGTPTRYNLTASGRAYCVDQLD